MQSTLAWIPEGDTAQTLATVAAMRDLAIHGAMTPAVRQTAAFIVAGLTRDQLGHASNLAGWIALHTRFLYDPAPFEALTPPDVTLAIIHSQGIAQMDCDDVAILAAALGLSIGLRARFVVIAFLTADAPYEHIWTELAPADGQAWVPVDPTRPTQGFPPVVRPPLVVEV